MSFGATATWGVGRLSTRRPRECDWPRRQPERRCRVRAFSPGRYGSFTASPVPEPGSLLLLGIGLIGLAIDMRSQKQTVVLSEPTPKSRSAALRQEVSSRCLSSRSVCTEIPHVPSCSTGFKVSEVLSLLYPWERFG